ncbi:MAG: endonuclease [Flavobacterium sp.]|nr:endonuclease [Flavobacterium sp.]
MKKNYTILTLFFALISVAQIPTGYYDSALLPSPLTGYTLKTQLKKIIDDQADGLTPEYLHADQGYGALWTLYANNNAFHDIYYENDNTILDMYSENPTGTDPYNFIVSTDQCGSYTGEGDCYNREHLVPQSYFDHFATNPMKNDPFHAVPSDGSVNGARNNLPFGVVNSANYTSQNGSKRGSNLINAYSTYNGTVFEPLDEFKGDIARSFFYFATRYEDLMDDFYSGANASTCEAKNMFDGSINKVFSDAFILRLIKWHLDDPVSQKEINQNNAIFAHQNNRNPYIDHPEFICQIYPTQCTQIANLSTNSFATNYISVYPNPSNNGNFTINSTEDLTRIVIYNINGQLIQEVNNPSKINDNYEITGLASGFYFLELNNNSAKQIKKIIVN